MPVGRILIGDDHTLVVEGFRRLLENDFEVIGSAADGRMLVRKALRLKPDVVLIDISLPIVSGVEAAKRIRRGLPEVKIIFVTMHTDTSYLRSALESGAQGYVVKHSAGNELVHAVRTVLTGGRYLSPELTRSVRDPRMRYALENVQIPDLTPRQLEVLHLIGSGRTNDEIANALGITVRTVHFHRSQIARKLGISGTPALTRYGLTHGLIPGETHDSEEANGER